MKVKDSLPEKHIQTGDRLALSRKISQPALAG